MPGVDEDRAVRLVEREATKQGLDLDAVRVVDDVDADGVVVRALETDAPDEVDQVGVQIPCPPGRSGFSMFESNVRQQLRALRDHVSGDGDSEGSTADENMDGSASRESSATSSQPSSESGDTTIQKPIDPVGLDLRVALDDDSLATLRDEHETLLEEIDERTVSEERVNEIEHRIDDVDDRLSTIEENLSMLSVGDES